MQQFQFVDAHCGAGKTMRLVEVIKTRHLSITHRIIIASPTKVLVNQTAANLRAAGISSVVIHGDTACKRVMQKYATDLLDETKRILCVTHGAFFTGLDFAKNGEFKVFIDEIPPIDTEHSYKLKNNKHFVLDAFQITPFRDDPDFCELTIKSKKLVNRFIASQNDDVDAVLHSLATVVASPNHHVACKADTFARFTSLSEPSEIFTASAIMRPTVLSRWPDVTFLGANFTNSSLHRCWTLDDAVFVPHPLFEGLSPVHPSSVGDRIKIGYFFDQPFSKNKIKAFGDTGVDIISEMGRVAEREFAGSPYLTTVNNGTSEASLHSFKTATVIDPVARGRNDLTHLHSAICAMAANDAPTHIAMMRSLFGFAGDELYAAHGFEVAYQFVCRTSVRVADSSEPLHFIVPDKRTADMLAHILSCQTVYRIEHEMALPERAKKESRSTSEINRRVYEKTKLVKAAIPTTGDLTARTFRDWVENGCEALPEGQNHFAVEIETALPFSEVKRRVGRNCLLRVQEGKGLMVIPLDTVVPSGFAQWLAEGFAKASTTRDIRFFAAAVADFGDFKHVNKNTNDLTKYVQRDFKKFLGKKG